METQENYIEMHLIVKNVGQSTMQGLTIVSGINRNLDISHKITLLLFVCNRIAGAKVSLRSDRFTGEKWRSESVSSANAPHFGMHLSISVNVF